MAQFTSEGKTHLISVRANAVSLPDNPNRPFRVSLRYIVDRNAFGVLDMNRQEVADLVMDLVRALAEETA